MPTGEHLAQCFRCGKRFVTGDAIPMECQECECKRLGHVYVEGLDFFACGRCGAPRPPRAEEGIPGPLGGHG